MRKVLRFLVWTAIIVGVIVGLARATALRSWRVPEDDPWLEASLAPTLRGGDLILLWRATQPSVGDLVMCPEPNAPGRIIVGRIVGEGGDRVGISGDTISVNGKKESTVRGCLERKFEVSDPQTGNPVNQSCSVESIAGKLHPRGNTSGHRLAARDVQQEVPADNVFLVSDNRLYSYDSRDYGSVVRGTCTETVLFRLWSKEGFWDVPKRFTYIQ